MQTTMDHFQIKRIQSKSFQRLDTSDEWKDSSWFPLQTSGECWQMQLYSHSKSGRFSRISSLHKVTGVSTCSTQTESVCISPEKSQRNSFLCCNTIEELFGMVCCSGTCNLAGCTGGSNQTSLDIFLSIPCNQLSKSCSSSRKTLVGVEAAVQGEQQRQYEWQQQQQQSCIHTGVAAVVEAIENESYIICEQVDVSVPLLACRQRK